MLNIKLEVSVKCINQALVSCKCLKCYRINKIACILSHYNMHIGMLLYKHTCKISNLICCYTTCYSKNNCLSLKHIISSRLCSHFLDIFIINVFQTSYKKCRVSLNSVSAEWNYNLAKSPCCH